MSRCIENYKQYVFNSEKAKTNCENYIHCKQKLFIHVFNRNAFCEGVDTCIFDINQSDRE